MALEGVKSEKCEENYGNVTDGKAYGMDNKSKQKPRKRVANFSIHEKALLAQLIKMTPIVESKRTDGKTVARKQAAWNLITQKFNSSPNVQKRETVHLKRAWDNMKALTRKSTKRSHIVRNGPRASTPEREAIISMVEGATPATLCKIKHMIHGDDAAKEDNPDDFSEEVDGSYPEIYSALEQNMYLDEDGDQTTSDNNDLDDSVTGCTSQESVSEKTRNQERHRSIDYRRDSNKLKQLENKNLLELQILKTKLEVQEIKKRVALLEEENNKLIIEKTKLELENMKSST